MAGEYAMAKEIVAGALASAQKRSDMDAESLSNALLTTLLGTMMQTHSRPDVERFVQYSLESLNEDEFLVTRGC